MAKAAAGGGGADRSVADELRRQRCEGCPRADGRARPAPRPQVRDAAVLPPQGARRFDQVTTPRTKWAPSPDHYPILKSAGGHLAPRERSPVPRLVQQPGLGWRTQIGTLLRKRKSLAEIAEALKRRVSPRPTARTGGRPPWCARPTCRRPSVGTAERQTSDVGARASLLLTISLLWVPRLAEASFSLNSEDGAAGVDPAAY